MRHVDEIIIHATATRPDFMAGKSSAAKVAEVRRWHVEDRNWRDIGYHFLIDRNGKVVPGRPLDQIGAHVRGHNTGSIGVALFGGHGSAETDSFSEHYTPDQESALLTLLSELQSELGQMKISGHNQYAAKACPGFNVPKWLAGTSTQPTTNDPRATAATIYRWRIAEIRDLASAALAEGEQA